MLIYINSSIVVVFIYIKIVCVVVYGVVNINYSK